MLFGYLRITSYCISAYLYMYGMQAPHRNRGACEVAVHTTGGVLERAISMERVTLPM